MAVSHQSPKQQRGEGFRRISETPPGLIGDHDDPVNHGPKDTNVKKGMTPKESKMKGPSGRRRGYKEPID